MQWLHLCVPAFLCWFGTDLWLLRERTSIFPPCEPHRGGMSLPDTLVWKSKSAPMRLSVKEGSGAHALQGLFNNRSEMTEQDVMWRDLLHWRMMERELAKSFPHHLLLKHLRFCQDPSFIYRSLPTMLLFSPWGCWGFYRAWNLAGPFHLCSRSFKMYYNRNFVPSQAVGPAVQDTETQHVLCHRWGHSEVEEMQDMI